MNMNRNNNYQALAILQAAQSELSKLNYSSDAVFAEEVEATKEYLQYAIDAITDDCHADNSLIHPENQF